MKLKVDHRLLHGKGIKFTFLVKKAISNSVPEHDENIHFDHIIIDCFDNDELSVIAFSNSVYVIRQFMEDIRGLKNEQIVALVSLEEEKKSFKYYRNHEDFLNNRELDKHIFMFCHINLGYDINYLRKGKDQKVFLVRQELIDKELFPVEQLANIQNLDFICETKPGHRAEFEKSMVRRFKLLGIEVTLDSIITGGSSTYMTLSAEKIGVIEKLCTMPSFHQNVRRVKISMRPIIPLCNESNVKEPHERDMEEPDLFNLKFIKKMKGLLKQCGVSKIVRERLLSIYRLYNESAGNMLQATYFKELKEALYDMKSFLEDFLSNERMPKQELETSLTTAINAFEEAFNNRLHVKGFSNKLEYNGSVQQYLTSFDFLYKQIIRIILPSDRISGLKPFQTAFATITGYEKVTSERMNLQLNINQITYPEFFATTVWKEVVNHHKPLFEKYDRPEPYIKECLEHFEIWKNFIKVDTSYKRIKSYLDKDAYSPYYDETYRIVHNLLKKEFLNNLVSDQIVFHFGFQRNFELFWHFYWKIFLQTSEAYLRMGKIDRTYFIDMLLRIMMVGVSDSSRLVDVSVDPDWKSNNEPFLLDHRNKPFDSLIADLWLSHYDKVLGCAKNIYKTLNHYEFSNVCEDQISAIEHEALHYIPFEEELKEEVFLKRKTSRVYNRYMLDIRLKFRINLFRDGFANFEFEIPTLMDRKKLTPDFPICLLHAFLLEVMKIDVEGKEKAVIRSVPRGSKGEKHILITDPDVSSMMINMPADPLGGLLIPDFDTRKKYFAVRTTFYRSIWNYQMMSYPLIHERNETFHNHT